MKYFASAFAVAATAAAMGLATTNSIHAFSVTSHRTASIVGSVSSKSPLFSNRASEKRQAGNSDMALSAAAESEAGTPSEEKKTLADLRKEGGPFSFNTPIGALNPYALYYFFVSVSLGIPWFVFVKIWSFFHWLSRGRFDPRRRIPITIGHAWGMTLLRLTRCYPVIRNREIVDNFFKKSKDDDEGKAVMFVANHCSWMDIPFLGCVMGWRNYKIVSKKELGKVPILGGALYAGGHVMVDRTNRRSQIKTLKQGISYLKDEKFIMATFPEGTRSRTGRLMDFQGGAFKMAHKAGAPVIPLSIVNSDKIMPTQWMMAMRPAYPMAEVIIHEPIASDDKTEEELVEAARKIMIEGLPESQRPL
mmetsp:Transcript_23145/g.54729  ORF Transcript_23145/g.54729 Transcript_23145/m.54729 type:complete len:362 (-) Transcript_23145:182-1267(-)|eukprot:CAMPEP_0197173800 /NCGR_PEP_ID=MMETSP1423-20130617/588_1 /TAXON_ID=476441 /ORGANISM="Pseudo-nitzschia heimii, Strain UNC1101" /LENGTH=361 /DNA_ID=CAMNT_0042622663 /DNA_START=75 /DNA_END=1160 /DNA_ORIENTATION=+